MEKGKENWAALPRPAAAGAHGGFAAVPCSPNPVLAAVGNFFYVLGFSAEVHVLRYLRVLRNIVLITGHALGILLRWLRDSLLSFIDDLTAPFRNFRQRRAQLARAQKMHRERGEKEGRRERRRIFARARMGTTLGFAAHMAGLFTPLLAALLLVVTVYSVLSMQYALEVRYNGQPLGFVTDQSVVEGAKALLRDRIRLAGNQRVEDWQLTPSYAIARAPSFTTISQLADGILLSGSEAGDIVPATGLYLNDNLEAVTADGEQLLLYLDEVLAQAKAQAPPDAEVAFAATVRCEPDNEEVFFASSVQPLDKLVEQLNSPVTGDVYATADGTAALEEIALARGLTVDALLARNPQLGGVDGTFVPENGVQLLIRRARPLLLVEAVRHLSYTETVPYRVLEQENPEKNRGVRQVVQRGANGLQQVWEDEFWIGGEYDRTVRQEELTTLVQPPVDEIIEIGTRSPQEYMGDLSGPGYIFPVPASNYSSRGMGPGHRGLDVNAPAGAPIYACESGTVVISGWHYSWGNYVVIDHGGGVQTLYGHCSALYVAAGQQVGKGTAIAAVGSTGNSSGNHLHLEVLVNGVPTDPVAYVGYPY